MVPGQPGPNMRAAAFQAQQTKTQSSSSILMPIYTIGIVGFFVFTIVKLVMRKTNKKEKTPREVTPDPVFEEHVFRPTQASAEPKDKKLGENPVVLMVADSALLIIVCVVLKNACLIAAQTGKINIQVRTGKFANFHLFEIKF